MLPIVILAVLVVAAAGFAIASIRALAPGRVSLDLSHRRQFLAEFDRDGLPANMLLEAYEALGRRVGGPDGRVKRDAHLATDLGLTAADVEDVALLVAARCNGRLPATEDLNALDNSVHTVAELVHFLTPFCADLKRVRRLALMA